MDSLDPTSCPRCGQPNACSQPATADGACWCFAVSIDPARLSALPPVAQGIACLCRACATAQVAEGEP